MFTPGIGEIAKDLGTSSENIVGATTGFVVFLGIGPLILAPLSETFGRRKLYLVCFSIFALLQIPTALSPNVETLIAVRTVSGFFGSTTFSVVLSFSNSYLIYQLESRLRIPRRGYSKWRRNNQRHVPPQPTSVSPPPNLPPPHNSSPLTHRSGIFGWYLLGPLLGPTLGPLFGGLIVQYLGWRWIFWILTIVCDFNTIIGFLFLKETYAPVILSARKQSYQRSSSSSGEGTKYRTAGQDDRPFRTRLTESMLRPLKILFTQPIVLTMAIYQAVLFGTTYSLYTNFQAIYGEQYGFNTTQVGLMYLGPGLGFLLAVWFIVPRIDTLYNSLTRKNNNESQPEFRLPLANIGAVLIPLSLFWFGWTVEYKIHWTVTVLATVFFGLGMITIINTVQNYYIDSFSKYAASAIAAGAVFRSIVGGIMPLGAPDLFEKVGYGWGVSVFAFLSVVLSPAPLLFFRYGQYLRELFAIEL